jgi:hypothetical protein
MSFPRLIVLTHKILYGVDTLQSISKASDAGHLPCRLYSSRPVYSLAVIPNIGREDSYYFETYLFDRQRAFSIVSSQTTGKAKRCYCPSTYRYLVPGLISHKPQSE